MQTLAVSSWFWIGVAGVLAVINAFGLILNRNIAERDRARRTVPFVFTTFFFCVATTVLLVFLWKKKEVGPWLQAHPSFSLALRVGAPLLYLASGINILVLSNLVDGAEGWAGVVVAGGAVVGGVGGLLAPWVASATSKAGTSSPHLLAGGVAASKAPSPSSRWRNGGGRAAWFRRGEAAAPALPVQVPWGASC